MLAVDFIIQLERLWAIGDEVSRAVSGDCKMKLRSILCLAPQVKQTHFLSNRLSPSLLTSLDFSFSNPTL